MLLNTITAIDIAQLDKNWLLSANVAGAKASAHLIQPDRNGLEPCTYLRHVFARLPQAASAEDMEALLHETASHSAQGLDVLLLNRN